MKKFALKKNKIKDYLIRLHDKDPEHAAIEHDSVLYAVIIRKNKSDKQEDVN